MPKRTDIQKILIIGSGPIIISQACEFDYSGTQACKALREEGYEIVLINSNPATIMTDPETADRTYIEPITPEVVAKVLARERPQALLPTLGGQTALNVAVRVAEMGMLERYGVELIGASVAVIKKAEDRELFREAMKHIGLRVPASGIARTLPEVEAIAEAIGYPLIVRPSFTLGGTGGGVAYNREELLSLAQSGLDASFIHTVMLEESVLGWKEFELEVMRDRMDNVVIICSIENVDAMGVHTGDSITVAPAQTLTDQEYQRMRDAAIAILREVGVETGGSNVQFAINPRNGEMVVIEMNPRVSRSSALASKATGFPIAKIAAKLAVGYSLDEIANDITRETRASFEPTIDYCVVKAPRFTFEKFPKTDDFLTTAMKSVGETMAIGRTFKEALHKAIRSLEIGRFGFWEPPAGVDGNYLEQLKQSLRRPNSKRLFQIGEALKLGLSVAEIHHLTDIDPWFLAHIEQLLHMEADIREAAQRRSFLDDPEQLRFAKAWGFSDIRLAALCGEDEETVRQKRLEHGIEPVYKLVDTCAAEFEAYTPYYYSTYETEDEARPSERPKVVILGGGPNRIGQGIEFDYCCVHASFSLREENVESIMVNSNPETVSTDYDTSDKLYFEPLTREDVLHILKTEKPLGMIVQFGGQTPLNLAVPLEKAGGRILGTSPDAIDLAEDRKRFQQMLQKLGLKQPRNGTALTVEEALTVAGTIGYPVVVRPSYVLGGRAMQIVFDAAMLREFMQTAVHVSPGHPILIDQFLEDAVELDVDAISDGRLTVIGGIMEHIEEAGIHSGDSACVLPPISIPRDVQEEVKRQTRLMAAELGVVGLMNVQFAIQKGEIYILEVNPRASRTIPFVSKAIGYPLAKLATKVMLGKSLPELGFDREVEPRHLSVKEAVFPFTRFPGVDILLGPEMKSTGEVMGIGPNFGIAFAKSQAAAGYELPTAGTVFISVHDQDKPRVLPVAKSLEGLGFRLIGTAGTAAYLRTHGIPADTVSKLREGRPHVVDHIKNGEVQLVINTSLGKKTSSDAYEIRRTTLAYNIPYTTTIAGAKALAEAVAELQNGDWEVKTLQEYHHASLPTPRSPLAPHHSFLPRKREECGIFGVFGNPEAAKLTYFGLYALQHRGQESAGIAVSDGRQVREHKQMGLVHDIFQEQTLQTLKGHLAIGHVRYSTTGSSLLANAQPFGVVLGNEYYGIGHNGNLVNAYQLRADLESRGAIFQSTMDTEVIMHLLARHLRHGLEEALIETLNLVQGAYSLVLCTRDKLIGIRDPRGFRPLCLGKLNGAYVLGSETCAFDLIEAEYIRDLDPGEILIIDHNGLRSLHPFPKVRPAYCIFEFIYFARPDSNIFGQNVYSFRKRLGRLLARENESLAADLVMPFPDSGNYAALGFAEASQMPFEMGVIRNHYVGRTFIQPSQAMRDFGVRVKLNPVRELLQGKRLVLVEDSIIRGTTTRTRLQALRKAGAKEVHMLVSCPPHRFPCPYGIDFSTKGELIAASHSVSEIGQFIGLDSLRYLSIQGLLEGANASHDQHPFCLACFTGDYPVTFEGQVRKRCFEDQGQERED